MNFDFSDEQAMLRDQARRFLETASARDRLRSWLDKGDTATQELWPQMAELGWLGAAIDESFGGLGLGTLELCVLSEELGRHLTPVPFFSTICIAAPLLGLCPPGARRDLLLSSIATGASIVCVAGVEDREVLSGSTSALSVTRVSGGAAIGTLSPVPDLTEATDLLVAGLEEDGEPGLVWVEATAAGVRRDGLKGFDPLRPHGRLQLNGAAVEVLYQGQDLMQVLQRVRRQAAVLAAFEQIGTAESALKLARDYALERFAFGRPLAGNQAVKHRLADMFVKIEMARSNAYYGAWAAATFSDELPRAAAAARLSATEALVFTAEESLQLHGGIGYTWEADCHLFLRRARTLATQLGSIATWSRELVATSA